MIILVNSFFILVRFLENKNIVFIIINTQKHFRSRLRTYAGSALTRC